MKRKSTPRLTLKTAKALAIKTLGSARGLEKDPDFEHSPYNVFQIRMGDFHVTIRRDWNGSDRLEVSIRGPVGTSYALYDPATLELDYDETDRRRERERRENFDDWVATCGLESCTAQIEKSWNQPR